MKENVKYVIIILGIATVVEVFFLLFKRTEFYSSELISNPTVD